MTAGRALPPVSRFAGDDGRCDPALAVALAVGEPRARLAAVVAALATARVLVPVVAHLDERAEPGDAGCADHGVVGEKVASAVMVTVAGPDGRAVTPVFSSVAAMGRWDPTARPVPVEAVRAALASAAEADGLLVLDPGAPGAVLVPRPAVWALAQGRPWVPALDDGAVRAAVVTAVGAVPGVVDARCESGSRSEVRVVLAVEAGLDRARLDAVVAAAGRALAADAVVAERVDSIELAVVAGVR